MMKNTKKLFAGIISSALSCCLLLSSNLSSDKVYSDPNYEEYNGFQYGFFKCYDDPSDEKILTIHRYIGPDTEKIVVPSEINGTKVKQIGESAFRNNETVKEIVIPDTVICIEGYAFEQCPNLERVNLPEGIKNINYGLFVGCSKLDNVKIPDGVEAIHQSAFFRCKSLAEISLPDSVYFIEHEAFSECKNLKSVRMPSNEKLKIEGGAFYRCWRLSEVDFPSKTGFIDEKAFNACFSLRRLCGHSYENISRLCSKSGIHYIDLDSTPNLNEVPTEGDVNTDGVISTADLTNLISIVINGSAPKNMDSADVYRDGEINSIDLAYLKNMLLL